MIKKNRLKKIVSILLVCFTLIVFGISISASEAPADLNIYVDNELYYTAHVSLGSHFILAHQGGYSSSNAIYLKFVDSSERDLTYLFSTLFTTGQRISLNLDYSLPIDLAHSFISLDNTYYLNYNNLAGFGGSVSTTETNVYLYSTASSTFVNQLIDINQGYIDTIFDSSSYTFMNDIHYLPVIRENYSYQNFNFTPTYNNIKGLQDYSFQRINFGNNYDRSYIEISGDENNNYISKLVLIYTPILDDDNTDFDEGTKDTFTRVVNVLWDRFFETFNYMTHNMYFAGISLYGLLSALIIIVVVYFVIKIIKG